MPGSTSDHSPPDKESTPAEVFALVGHELRAEIIWVLGGSGNDETALTFGELRSRLATDVEPSQLHYHLKQLVGHFIKKTDDGYRLSASGIRLYFALRSGTFNREQEHLAVDTDVDCYHCQEPIEADFTPLGVRIACSGCEHRYGGHFLDVPFAAFQDGEEAFSHFRRYIVLESLFIARGVCPSCGHPLSPELYSGEDHPYKVCIHQSCELCGMVQDLSVGQALLADVGLRLFCHDHGVDTLSTPYWELEFAATDDNVTIRSTDPWEVALEVTFDDDTLELVVDDELTVLERNRDDAAATQTTCSPAGPANEEGLLPAEDECLQYLRRHRWPDEVACPHCGSSDVTKKGTTSKDAQRYACQDCERIFNDLTGTIFADHQLSLPEMFYITREMDDEPTTQISEDIDRSYKAVLEFVHEVQDASSEWPGSHEL